MSGEVDPGRQRPRAEDVLRTLLLALEDGQVLHCLRQGQGPLAPGRGGDVDVLVRPDARSAAARVLRSLGWRLLSAPGHVGHDFWLLATSDSGWVKIDLVSQLRYGTLTESTSDWLSRRRLVDGVWLAAEADLARHRQHRLAGRRERPTTGEKILRHLPAGRRRPGPVIAVLGPDGAGKGTVVDALREALPVAVTTAYLGVGARPRTAPPAAGTPVRSAGPRGGDDQRPPRTVRVRELAFLSRKWLRTVPPLARAYGAAWRGHVVLLDRHALDAVAVAPRRSRWGGRYERFLATRLTPRPDALIVLDAPGEVLYARKGEHDPQLLDQWRAGYRSLPGPGVHVVDATAPREEVVSTATDVVWSALVRRRRWPRDH